MNKALLTVIFCIYLVGSGQAYAKNEKYYPADSISEELLKHANAVVRNYELTVNIDEDGKTVTTTGTYVITVLNEQGRDKGNFSESYSPFEKMVKLEGAVYDAKGDLLTKIRKSDFSARNASPYNGYYDDVKIWGYKVSTAKYPYTVVYQVTSTYDHTFYLPDFRPWPPARCAVERASFQFKAPAWFKVKYKCYGYNETYPVVHDDGGDKQYYWEVAKLPARKEEPLQYIQYPAGSVLITPVEFALAEHRGSTRTWEDFSTFVYKLNENREDLPEDIKVKVSNLTKGVIDTFEKIQTLYKFLQDNTRYVAIEYGINGWQTMPAKYTAEQQFGDCKALSYYMKALLAEAGIPSNTVLVYAGEQNDEEVVKELPGPQFNHVILQVPLKRDTVWLECTSSELPAGFLGDFTQNRDVLVLAEKGGKLVRTPAYDTACNKIYRHVKARCNEDGGVSCSISNMYYGQPAMDMYMETEEKQAYEIDRYASNKFSLQSYTVTKAEYKTIPVKRNIVMTENLEISAGGMQTKAGKYTVLNYNLLPLDLPELHDVGERQMPFQLSGTMQVVDSFVIDIPNDLAVSGAPGPMEEVQPFGYYYRKVDVQEDRVVVTRKLAEFQGVYEPEMFSQYVQWLDRIRRDGTNQLMLSGK